MSADVRTGVLLVVVGLSTACAESSPPTVPDDAPTLLETELMSGGIGTLESSDFLEFELAAAVDTGDLQEVIPNRWANFAVRVDGVEVDSWRPDGPRDRIEFRVPLGHSGGVAIRVTGVGVQDADLAGQRLGLVATYSYNYDCADLEIVAHEPPHLVPINRMTELEADLVSIPTRCYEIRSGPDDEQTVVTGHAVLVPGRAGSLRFIPEGSSTYVFGGDPELRTWMSTAGVTFVDGEMLLERAVLPGSAPDIWRVRPGTEIEFVAPASCPELPTYPFAVAELAPGLCLTFDGSGAVRRNGDLVFEYAPPCCGYWPALGFVKSSDGKTLLTGFDEVNGHFDLGRLAPSSMPVFGADGALLYEVDAYRAIYAAFFSPSGDELFVVGAVEVGEEFLPVIDRRSASTGSLTLRRERPDWRRGTQPVVTDVRGARVVNGALWIAMGTLDGGPDAAIEVVDMQTHETLRSVAVPADPVPYYGTNVGLYPGTLILPDPSGRRATLVSRWDGLDALVGFTIDVFPDS